MKIKAIDSTSPYSMLDFCKPNTTKDWDFRLFAASNNFTIADNTSTLTNTRLVIKDNGSTQIKGNTAIELYGQTNNSTTYGNFVAITEAHFRPGADNSHYLGAGSFRWHTVYATNGVTTTSDRNLKKDISSIEDKYIQLFNKL
jgi:hypothetical protein